MEVILTVPGSITVPHGTVDTTPVITVDRARIPMRATPELRCTKNTVIRSINTGRTAAPVIATSAPPTIAITRTPTDPGQAIRLTSIAERKVVPSAATASMNMRVIWILMKTAIAMCVPI